MIRDLQHALPSPDLRADVAVVGAGAAGITLAVELARLGQRVLLLEGGGPNLSDTEQALCRTELTGRHHRGAEEGRFRVQGGTTTKWGGQILELEGADFESHSWIAGSGWPFPKQELAPFYARALELEGIGGAIADDPSVWQALRETPPSLERLELYLSRWCPEPNFARLHQAALENNPNIELWLHSNAVELVFNEGVATGVRCRTLGGQEAVFQANQFIFALGTIESSRFFLQPRREGSLPWNRSGLLGRHFQDHVDSDAAVLRPRSPDTFHAAFDSIFLRGFKYNPKLRLSPEARETAHTLAVGGTVFSTSSADEALADVKGTAKHLLRGRLGEVAPRQIVKLVQHAPLVARQAYRYSVQHRGFHAAGAELRLRVHCEQEPLSASSISLSPERDSLGLQRARLDWRISLAELRSIRCFVHAAQTALAPLAEVVPHPDLLAGNDGFLEHCQDGFHHMGGMRMDPSPDRGVVDENLRLHSTENVFVCSAAAFPTSGFSNPTHTLLALAVRLAHHVSHAR